MYKCRYKLGQGMPFPEGLIWPRIKHLASKPMEILISNITEIPMNPSVFEDSYQEFCSQTDTTFFQEFLFTLSTALIHSWRWGPHYQTASHWRFNFSIHFVRIKTVVLQLKDFRNTSLNLKHADKDQSITSSGAAGLLYFLRFSHVSSPAKEWETTMPFG